MWCLLTILFHFTAEDATPYKSTATGSTPAGRGRGRKPKEGLTKKDGVTKIGNNMYFYTGAKEEAESTETEEEDPENPENAGNAEEGDEEEAKEATDEDEKDEEKVDEKKEGDKGEEEEEEGVNDVWTASPRVLADLSFSNK